MEGILFKLGAREEVKTFCEKEVKFYRASTVADNELAAVVGVNIPADQAQSKVLTATGEFADATSAPQVAVAAGS